MSAYQNLLDGVRSFQQSVYPEHRALFESLAGGQSPQTLFITCSDSRIDPSLLTQSMPGELFVIRTAGNFVPPKSAGATGTSATVEYAVRVLNVKHIVVCGHSKCGAMQGVLDTGALGALPDVREWVRHGESVLETLDKRKPALHGEHRLNHAIELNVLLQLEHLKSLPSVRERLDASDLHLHGWVYRFETGEVLVHDPRRKAFVPSSEASHATA